MSSASTIGEIVELVGSSDKSWEDAAQTAVKEAVKTIRNVHAIEVLDMTAKVDPNTGNIKEYRVGIKLAFVVGAKVAANQKTMNLSLCIDSRISNLLLLLISH
jgi:flavin-binding protein dodecin